MKFFYASLIIFGLLFFSCQQREKENITTINQLTAQDSLIMNQLLDSLTNNYSQNEDSLSAFSNSIAEHFPHQKAIIDIRIAFVHYSQGKYSLAGHYFQEAANEYLKDSLLEKQAEQLANIGVTQEVSGQYTKAIDTYLHSLAIFDSLKITLKSALLYNNIGIVYQQLKEFDKALNYYKKSLSITEELGRDDINAKRYNNIASVFEDMKINIDSSLFYYQKAYTIWKRDTNIRFLAIVENNLGKIYLVKNNLSKAEKYFNKALKLCLMHNQKNNLAQIYRNQAQLFIYQKKYSKAIHKAKKAIDLAHTNSNKEIESESMSVLVDALEQAAKYKEANHVQMKYFALRQEISGLEQKKQINRLNIQFQTRGKEHKIEVLALENGLQKREIVQQWLIITLLFFVLAGGILSFSYYKNKSKMNLLKMRNDISDYISQIEEIREKNNETEREYQKNILSKIKQFNLSEREEEVLLYISKGYKNAEIADKMFVSLNTIKTHTKNIYSKLNVRNRTEAARKISL